jgi:hypothetical protein
MLCREALGCSGVGVKFRSRGGVIIALDFEIILWAVVATLAFVGELLSISFFLLFFALGATVALVVALWGRSAARAVESRSYYLVSASPLPVSCTSSPMAIMLSPRPTTRMVRPGIAPPVRRTRPGWMYPSSTSRLNSS